MQNSIGFRQNRSRKQRQNPCEPHNIYAKINFVYFGCNFERNKTAIQKRNMSILHLRDQILWQNRSKCMIFDLFEIFVIKLQFKIGICLFYMLKD